MGDLAAWILERIEEDEAVAKHWQAAMDADEIEPHVQGVPAWVVMAGGVVVPARVLAQCAAYKAIVELHEFDPDYGACRVCAIKDGTKYADGWGDEPWPCPTLRALASIWAAHEDYDPAWGLG